MVAEFYVGCHFDDRLWMMTSALLIRISAKNKPTLP